MKIHLIGSPNGNKKDYQMIAGVIQDLGHTLITEYALELSKDNDQKKDNRDSEEYLKKAKKWIKKSDLVIVEASESVFGAGFEVATAASLNKPVIVLHRPNIQKVPFIVRGMNSDKLQVLEYSEHDIQKTLSAAIDFARDSADTRFNFFISPRQANYLDWISRTRKLPRSVYLRQLIKKDQAENQDYSKQA